MLVNPLKDLLDAFVIGAVNRIFTVATVENQHFEPWKRRMCVPRADLNQSSLHYGNTPSQYFEFRFNFLVMSFRELMG